MLMRSESFRRERTGEKKVLNPIGCSSNNYGYSFLLMRFLDLYCVI